MFGYARQVVWYCLNEFNGCLVQCLAMLGGLFGTVRMSSLAVWYSVWQCLEGFLVVAKSF